MIAKTLHNYFNNQWEILQLVNTFKIPWLSVPNVHGHFFGASLEAQWIKKMPANAADTGSSSGPGRFCIPHSS